MKIEDRKMLCKYIGIDWKEDLVWVDSFRQTHYKLFPNPSLNNWEDLGNLKERMVENGDWNDFEDYALQKKNEKFISMISLTDFIMKPETCQLIADWRRNERQTI